MVPNMLVPAWKNIDACANGGDKSESGGRCVMADANKGDDTDRVELFERMTEVLGRAQQTMTEFWVSESAKPGAAPEGGALFGQWAAAWSDWASAFAASDSARLTALAGDYWEDTAKLWAAVLDGRSEEIPAAAEVKGRRLAGDAWETAPIFDLLRRSYLLASHYIEKWPETLDGVSDADRRKLAFESKQLVDAMSPANFAALNPEVLEEARRTNGESLTRGLANLLADLKRGKLTMTDEDAFEVGGNVAVTPGKVIFEGPLFQLIQYAPTTDDVYETPLLILPPWINKYYILDLTPAKSLIRWAVEQGFTVYVVSWAQGSAAPGGTGFEDFAIEGELKAIDLVLAASGAESAHVVGYCVAGSVLAATLAYMAATGQQAKVASATFFTSQVDFTEAGDLLHFIRAPMLDTVQKLVAEKGYLDGRWLATSFNFLRPADLLWNYVVNNYLKGKENAPFDLLYWNSDPTDVPGRFVTEYLTWLYRDNLLAKPGAIRVGGVAVDLRQVQTPAYIQAGKDDHIAPAVSCFKMTRAFGGEHRFLLAGSGHIAGVVNPPASGKYGYWALPAGVPTPATLEEFQQGAVETKGSWWPDWAGWLVPRSGAKVKARVPGAAKGFPAIEDAPGRYVRERIA